MTKARTIILTGALFLALFASAMYTVPVLADESTPTPTPEQTNVEETTQPTESQDEAQPEETPQPEPTVDSVSEEESQPVAEILEQLPEDTTLVVLDEEGQAVSLATQEAEDAVLLADPRWCPASAVPPAGCSPYFSSFLDLIAWLDTNDPGLGKAGTIWIDAAYDSSVNDPTATDFILNGGDLPTMAKYALTINGGWLPNASFGGSAISTTDLSEINVPFKIINWNAPVTIKNIIVTGASGADYALEVGTTAGLITVTNVDVSNNNTTLGGANLSNNLAPTTSPGVTVNDSNFNDNNGNGLEVNTKGAINLKNVNVNGNSENGAFLVNTFATTAQAVNLTGTNSFKYNGFDGLKVFSKGVITLNYITASYNGENGVYLDNCAMDFGSGFCTNTFASAVTIKGYNYFSNNGLDGLRVFSNGVITVSNITANNNGTGSSSLDRENVNTDYDAFGKGVYLDNSGATTVPTTKRGVVVNGTNFFNNNISNGLFIISDGLITIANITAHENQCDEIAEDGSTYCAGVYLYSNGGITQTGYINVADNLKDGLRIISYNTSTTLTTLYADGNGRDGIHFDGSGSPLPANITINGLNFSNNNTEFGFWVTTNGAVTLNNLVAKTNGNAGLFVDNTLAVSAKSVVLKGTNIFQDNGDTGLTITSRGAISTSSITSVGNAGQAAILDNCDYDVVLNCQAYTTLATVAGKKVTVYQAVSMTGVNYLNGNGNGLLINSRGAISITNLTSLNHTGDGASLKNDYINAVGNVTLSGTNNLSSNSGGNGIEINTRGTVTLSNVTANFNNKKGVEIYNNADPLKPTNVTVSGTNYFNNNGETGLSINSYGTVTISNITASDNGNPDAANGVRIDNATGTTTAKSVVVSGTNYFEGNHGTGLYIYSKGGVSIYKVTANNNNNGGDGVYIENAVTSGSQPVTVYTYGVFLNNEGSGLEILSSGKVTITTITANDNAVHGVDINTHYDLNTTTAVDVIVSGVNYFTNNLSNGLQIFNDGAITVSNIFANANGNDGAYLDNLTFAGSSVKAIAVNGVNNFSSNTGNGLHFLASGAVTLTRVTADNNGDDGLNTGSGIFGTTNNKAITFTCGSVNGNEELGLKFVNATVITLKGVYLGQANSFSVPPVVTRACTLP